MKKNTEILNHALHNEEACNYLALKPELTDWIITTAFYTSLHFVSHRIFPFKIKGKGKDGREVLFENIFQYQNFKGNQVSRHKLMGELAFRYCAGIAPDYQRLYDMSCNARYINYRQPPEVANLAKRLMSVIKKFCTTG